MKDKIMYYNIFSTPINPKVIFYGECLPLSFLLQFIFISGCDLAFIMGNSLKVSPSNQLPDKLSSGLGEFLLIKKMLKVYLNLMMLKEKIYFLEDILIK